jgi:hypothetical protein
VPKREQLSSVVNDAGSWFVAALFGFSLVCSVVWLPLHLAQGGRQPALLAAPLQACVLFFVWRWGKRRSSHVFASPAGLELPGLARTIPWKHLEKIEDLGMLGGLLVPLYRLHFSDGAPPLTFYARVNVEQTIARFRS